MTPDPLTLAQLRELDARTKGNPDARLLLLEIKRLHDVLRSIEGYRSIVDEAFKEATGSHLVAAYRMRIELSAEPAIQPRKLSGGL